MPKEEIYIDIFTLQFLNALVLSYAFSEALFPNVRSFKIFVPNEGHLILNFSFTRICESEQYY